MAWLDKYSDDVSKAQKGKKVPKKTVSESTSVGKDRIPISSKDMVKTIPGTNTTVNSNGEFVVKDEKGIYRPIKREQATLSQGKKKSAAELKKEQEILKEMRSNDLGLRAPLQYLANPDQMLGDLGNATGFKPLQNFSNSDEDAIRYNYQAVDPSKTVKERLDNNFNEALSLTPKAGLNLALASMATKGNVEALMEAYNPIPLPYNTSPKYNVEDDFKYIENQSDSMGLLHSANNKNNLIGGFFPRRDYNNVIGANKLAETLPKEMEPYISKRMLNDTREQEIFESSFPVELQQILRDKRTQYLDREGNTVGPNSSFLDLFKNSFKNTKEAFNPKNLETPSGNQWLKDWYNDDITKEKINKLSMKQQYNDLEFPADKRNSISAEDYTELNFLRSVKRHDPDFSVNHSYFNDPNKTNFEEKNYIDLIKDKGIGVYLNKFLNTGGLSYGTPDSIYTNRAMFLPYNKKGMESIKVHEGTHTVNGLGNMFSPKENEMLLKPFGEDLYSRPNFNSAPSIFDMKPYYTNPTEIHARMNQSRFENNLTPKDTFTEQHFKESMQKNNFNGMGKYIKNKKEFIDLMNNFYTPAAILGGAAAVSETPELKSGGIVKDNYGYWNPDNWGKPVEIDGTDITMQGVNQPLLGISDTGDTKLMEPGKNYKFKGKKVTEFPIAKNGINNLNAKPLQKLEDLTNFTNYNQDKGWLNKYN